MSKKLSVTSQSLNKLEEQITCPICLDHFTDPKILPCFHSFCISCLESVLPVLVEGNHAIDCPTCRSRCPVPEGGIAFLPSSFIINNFMEVYELMKKVSDRQHKEHIPCDNCSNANADRYCKQCAKFFCTQCLHHHDNWKPHANHQLLTLDEIAKTADELPGSKPEPTVTCSDHDKPLKLFCETCQELICRDCTVKKHTRPDHDYDLVSDVYSKQEKALLTGTLEPLTRQFQRLHRAKQVIVEEREAVSQQAKATKEEIQHTIAELKDSLDRTEKNLMGDVDSTSSYKFGMLDHQLSQIELLLGQIIECKDQIEHSIKIGPPQQVLLTKKQIVSKSRQVIANVKDKTFEPLEKSDIKLVKNNDNAILNMHRNIASVSSTLTAIYSSKLAYSNIPVVNHPSRVILSLVSSDGSLVPVPSTLIQCRLFSSDKTSPLLCAVMDSCKSELVGQYDILFTPIIRTTHQLHISVGGSAIQGSPFDIPVTAIQRSKSAPRIDIIPGLNRPSGVAVTDDGLVVVCESFNHCISVLNEKRKMLSFGSKGSNKGQLKFPQGVVVTSKGTILVADRNNNRIQEFTMQGICLSCVGTKGKGPLKFRYPRGIAIIKKTGHVLVADTGNNCIQVLNPDLSFLHSVSSSEAFSPHDLTVDNLGSVYVTDFENHSILKFAFDDQKEPKLSKFFDTKGGGSEPGQLCYPSGISVDSNNNKLYVVNSRNQYVVVLSTDGCYANSINKNYENESWGGTFDGVVLDNTCGTLYVCCPNKNMLKLF